MGNKNQGMNKIDANSQELNIDQILENQRIKMSEILKQAFNQSCQNKQELDEFGFNEALQVLENFNLKRLRDSPLGYRLFRILDGDKNNKLNYEEFECGLLELLNNKEMRIIFSFKAYDKDEDNQIKPQEFINFIEDSWNCAFRTLANQVQQQMQSNQNILKDVVDFGTRNISLLRIAAENQFSQIDKAKKGFINYQDFKIWVVSNPDSTITAKFHTYSLQIPLNLYYIDTHS